jgi:Fur family transcriptional regulator, peroxide stress response regulator
MNREKIILTLRSCGLKITPQRIAVYEAVINQNNHPTAENVIEYIKTTQPNIATGTVYKTLDTLVNCGIIKKVKTDNDIMRYDAIIERHHHLFSVESDRIEDLFDEELDEILDKYLKDKKIPRFEIQDVKLHILGKFC